MPFDAGNDQFNGLVNGALNTTLPPHELAIVNVPVVGMQLLVVNVPDNVYCPPTHGPGVAVSVLQLGAV